MPEYNPLTIPGVFSVPRQAAVNDSTTAYSASGIDATPMWCGGIVLTAALVLVAMKLLGFRAMIGVNA